MNNNVVLRVQASNLELTTLHSNIVSGEAVTTKERDRQQSKKKLQT
jgi:hypothetical protein